MIHAIDVSNGVLPSSKEEVTNKGMQQKGEVDNLLLLRWRQNSRRCLSGRKASLDDESAHKMLARQIPGASPPTVHCHNGPTAAMDRHMPTAIMARHPSNATTTMGDEVAIGVEVVLACPLPLFTDETA